jgi:3-phenylpropionate/trans-cinnamate dioxygenase ferredoxin reductase subunit
MNDDGLVILGAGLAGAKAAEGARRVGWDGPIRLCGNEHFLPYERPNLSKGILTGTQPVRSSLVHADSFVVDHEIDLLLGAAATEVALDERTVTLRGGRRLRFAKLVLATGSTPRRPPIPGAELDHVYTFRSIDDALAMKDRLVPGRRVAVVGASWIGTELAASARQRGCDVVLIGPQATPLERILGPEVGAAFATLHGRNGVELKMGVGVERILGSSEPVGVRLDDGSTTEADTVILGVGVTPNVDLAQAAGLDIDNGVLVDETLATSHPDVYAVGDIANAHNPILGRRVRVEHWANALYQGLTGGANAAGARTEFDRIPYFYSDQFDLAMEYSGWPIPWQQVVFRGDPTSGSFVAFYLNDGRVVAGANVNVAGVNSYVRTLIRSATPVDLALLQDPNVDPARWLPGTPLHRSDRD